MPAATSLLPKLGRLLDFGQQDDLLASLVQPARQLGPPRDEGFVRQLELYASQHASRCKESGVREAVQELLGFRGDTGADQLQKHHPVVYTQFPSLQ